MKNKIILADDNIPRLLLKLSLPATVGMIVMALYNVVDTIFVGRGVGTLGIAGISIVFPFQMFVMAIGQMIGIGSASLISRSLGANNFQRAEKTLGNVLLIVLITSFVLILPSYLFMDKLLGIFGASRSILPFAKEYLHVILAGTQFFVFLISFNNIIRAEGRAKIAMGTMIVSAIINMILDPIFIFILKLGIRGAALATVISQLISVIYVIYFFQAGKSILKIRKLSLIFPFKKRFLPLVFLLFRGKLQQVFW
jgi:putative MATE family efflux protein